MNKFLYRFISMFQSEKAVNHKLFIKFLKYRRT